MDNELERAEAAEMEIRTILASLKKHCSDDFVVIVDGAIDWQQTITEFVGYIQLDAKEKRSWN